FAGAWRDQSLEPSLIAHLHGPPISYASRGIAFGLAAIATPTAAVHLSRALRRWLATPDHAESVAWVCASLQLLDHQCGTTLLAECLEQHGPWSAALETL